MWDVFARVRMVVLGLGVLAAGSVVEASNISFKAIKKNDVVLTAGVCNLTTFRCTTGPVGKPCANNNDCPIGTNNLSVVANDKIEVEMYLSNWINDFPVDAVPNRVRIFQVIINPTSYVSIDNGTAKPFGWCGPVSPISCTVPATCPSTYPICDVADPITGLDYGCTCAGHNPTTGAFITINRNDFLLFGVDGPLPEVAYNQIGFKYYGIAENTAQAITDSGVARYLGTLIVKVSPNACGTFNVGFVQEIQSTFITDPSPKPIASLPSLTPLVLTVSDCSRQLLSCSPSHCNIDARIAHDRLDVDAPKNAFQITMTFSKLTQFCSNANTTSCNLDSDCPGGTCVKMTASDFEVTMNPPPGPKEDPVPSITGLTANPADRKITTVNFQPRMAQTHWTCFRHKESNKRCCISSLPADADNSRISQADDVFEMVDNLSGCLNPPTCNAPLLSIEKCDTDRSVRCSPADVLMVVDLLNGADAFEPVAGNMLPTLTNLACPSMNLPP